MKLLLVVLMSIFSGSSAFGFDQDHKILDKLLKSYTVRIDGQVLVDYKGIKDEGSLLKSYTKQLEAVDKSEFKKFSKNERLAFWMNAYNAYTLELIVKNYSKKLKSIKDLGSLFSSPWSKKFIKLMGKKMSLDDIEHGTIRKRFKEARIHFAVNCASIGCPSLLEEAFVATKLDAQLEKATKLFLENTKKNNYNKKEKTLYLSKIFDWYGGDFEKYHGSVKNFVRKYIDFPKKSDVDFLDYDWKLNRK